MSERTVAPIIANCARDDAACGNDRGKLWQSAAPRPHHGAPPDDAGISFGFF